MADPLIAVRGIEETCAALSNVPKAVAKQAFGKALAAAAVPVVEALRPRIPSRNNLFDDESFKVLDGTAEEGTLVSSLMTDVAVDAEGKGGRVQIGFGKNGWVARMVEFGHRMIGHKPGMKEQGNVVPHPFMGPAAMASADAAIDAFAGSVAQSLESGEVKVA